MDGENHGKPYEIWMIWSENLTIFGNIHISMVNKNLHKHKNLENNMSKWQIKSFETCSYSNFRETCIFSTAKTSKCRSRLQELSTCPSTCEATLVEPYLLTLKRCRGATVGFWRCKKQVVNKKQSWWWWWWWWWLMMMMMMMMMMIDDDSNTIIYSWWLNHPNWKMLYTQIGSSSQKSGWTKTTLKPPPNRI